MGSILVGVVSQVVEVEVGGWVFLSSRLGRIWTPNFQFTLVCSTQPVSYVF